MPYHRGCKNRCGHILTSEEADPDKNPSLTCAWCKERKLTSPEELQKYCTVASTDF